MNFFQTLLTDSWEFTYQFLDGRAEQSRGASGALKSNKFSEPTIELSAESDAVSAELPALPPAGILAQSPVQSVLLT